MQAVKPAYCDHLWPWYGGGLISEKVERAEIDRP